MEGVKLEQGEHVILAARKHWLVYVGGALPYAIIALLPLAVLEFLAATAFPWAALIDLGHPLMRFGLGAWWLFVWLAAFSTFMHYFLDIWIVTNKRIIDVEQYDFFRREVTSIFLDRVEDATIDVTGFFHTLFGFGVITVQSAGAAERLTLPGVPNPAHIRNAIMDATSKYEKEKARHL